MNRIIPFFFLQLFLVNFSFSQTDKEVHDSKTKIEKCSNFYKTPALRDLLSAIEGTEYQQKNVPDSDRDRKIHRDTNKNNISDIGIPQFKNIDPLIQKSPAQISGRNMIQENWDGQLGSLPPDPTGAAGTDYFLQAVNDQYRVFNKDGTAAASAISLDLIWGVEGRGDPIVMYDKFAERWFISQFYLLPDMDDTGVMIAVSQSSDPLGEYYAYTFSFDEFPDYPKYSVWSNGYYMSANADDDNCCVFERDKMLLGDPGARIIKMTFPDLPDGDFRSHLPADADGPNEPEIDEPCYFFVVQDDSFDGVDVDHIKVLKATVNWDAPETSTITISQSLTTAPFNSVFSGTYADIRQRGTSQKLDPINSILMYRAQYRRFDGYNTIVLSQTVDVDDTDRAGVRWYELRDNNTETWSIYQQGTHSPDEENSRWISGISMDYWGNIGLAYSFSGPDDYAGLRFTGRHSADPLGEMTIIEEVGIAGTGSQTTSARYGDYAHMTIDPTDDETFWFTGQYVGPGGARKTRVFSFKFGDPSSGLTKTTETKTFNIFQPTKNTIQLSWYNIYDDNLEVQILDIQGKLIGSMPLQANEGEMQFVVPQFANGIYVVTLVGSTTLLSKKLYLGK
ncbi:T9SS type A sorting domain-containing protein [Crocinitomix catalasitica]|uniref:T9SS type A sorting domain-containing protein n=1 Tax=Crocinitomix catalasitica TaxID=184607 RepID=UPI0006865BF2|nr:T9SS type A sorting domain-containing protein [Crocinitomix catalasitica]